MEGATSELLINHYTVVILAIQGVPKKSHRPL